MKELKFFAADEQATSNLGRQLVAIIKAPMVIFLEGNLGAGKTSLIRAILQSLGYRASVKSPTYTLVEEYSFPDFELYHFDLYRIKNLDELLNMGFNDYFTPNSVCMLEWPKLAENLVKPDLRCEINILNSGREFIFTSPHKEIEKKLLTCTL